eukprot:TRINITY_DN17380_c0_g1_i1.p1 TRINITY_DN17380_c0_g1~~TRINITY_DN17380_c0_g1_i1.p1  ORF type:complete len:1179 (+),score=191.69 TRINITY_DN17380_c0_g1_i1:6-3542(+)
MVSLVAKWSWGDSSWTNSWSREGTTEATVADLEKYREKKGKDRPVKVEVSLPEVARWEKVEKDIESAISALRSISSSVDEEMRQTASHLHEYERRAHSMLRARWAATDMWSATKWYGGTIAEAVSSLEEQRSSLRGSVSTQIRFGDFKCCNKTFPDVDAASQSLQMESGEAAEHIALLLAMRFSRAATRRASWGEEKPFWGHLGPSWALYAPAWRHLQSIAVGADYPEPAEKEISSLCADCGLPSEKYCYVCGLAVCNSHILLKATSSGSKAKEVIPVCNLCADIATARAKARTELRAARADELRRDIKNHPVASLSGALMEDAKDCATCGAEFGDVPGISLLKHNCCACRRALCAICFCGSYTCMASFGRCPHKIHLHPYGIEATEKVCKDCLECVTARVAAAAAAQKFVQAAGRYLNHCTRLVCFLEDPDHFPHYEQEYVDTGMDKLKRGGGIAASGAKALAPFLPGGWAIAANAAKAVYEYGHYGLLGIFLQSEIADSLKILVSASTVLQEIGARDLLVGGLYLSIDQRKALRDDPEALHREFLSHGEAVSQELVNALLGFAGLGLHAPYQVNAFEAQRFALQQNWRLVTERLSESGLHQPAWCLYAQHEKRTVVIAVRGTDLDKSYGGDLFTDFNALPESTLGYDGTPLTAHCGMLASARSLELELWPTVRELVARSFHIIFVGHSLGAGVVALLVWLAKHGRYGQWLNDHQAQVSGIGYATPCVVDKATAEMMRPYFVSVVNPVDVVPRLSLSTIAHLAAEIRACARDSKEHFFRDTQDQVDHALTVWQPRVRSSLGSSERAQDAGGAAEEETNEELRCDSEDTAAESAATPSIDKTISHELRTLECEEGNTLEMPPGGVENIKRAWFGICKFQWQEREGRGHICTDTIKDILSREGNCPVATKVLGFDPAPGSKKSLLVEVVHSEIRTVRCKDGTDLIIPAGSASVVRAWYGDSRKAWQVREGVGDFCTEQVQQLTKSKGVLKVSSETIGFDPAPGRSKCLLVDVWHLVAETELFCAGRITAIYRTNGGLQAAIVPCDLPSMRRIIFDKRLFTDHKATDYHRALLNVHARMNVREDALVKWQGFAQASNVCPCCLNDYAWMRASKSEKQRIPAMTNCRACGIVVCTGCATVRHALPEQGILEPARVCDRCAFSPPDGGAAMWQLKEILASNG